ncbi:hypothetical protein RSAG8_13088, partial [Rhizoctonia solani AG-8 WAC10335]
MILGSFRARSDYPALEPRINIQDRLICLRGLGGPVR